MAFFKKYRSNLSDRIAAKVAKAFLDEKFSNKLAKNIADKMLNAESRLIKHKDIKSLQITLQRNLILNEHVRQNFDKGPASTKFIEGDTYSSSIIIKNPDVEDYFKILKPLASLEEYYEEYGDQIAKWYEEGKVIVFEKAPFKYNVSLLHEVEFPVGRNFQKIVTDDILEPITKKYASKDEPHSLSHVFRDTVAAGEFQNEVSGVNDQLRKFAKLLFPKYEFIADENLLWRFNPTYPQGIHIDAYSKKYNEVQTVRLFMNMDYIPRIWNSSHSLDVLLEKYYDIYGKDIDRSLPNEFNREFSRRIFGMVPSKDNMPKHMALFAPGTLWMVNSLIIPHEIFFGRRMVSASFFAKNESMLDPSKSFYNKIMSLDAVKKAA